MKELMGMLLMVLFCVLSFAQAENQNTKQIADSRAKLKNKEITSEYEDFARKLKKRTDESMQFSKENIKENHTDIDAILNKSIPNWQSLNTNKKQQSQGVMNNENQDIGSVSGNYIQV